MAITKVSAKGQVVIPSEIRKAIQLEEGDNFAVYLTEDQKIIFEKISVKPLRSLRGALAPKDGRGAELDYKQLRREAWDDMMQEK